VARGTVIIGASGDIGRSIALKLRATGRRLFLTHSLRAQTQDGELVHDPDAGLSWAAMDLHDKGSIDDRMGEAAAFLGAPFDMVYAAGIARDAPLMLTSDESWDLALSLNLTAPFRCMRALARDMSVAGSGNIVLIGSTGGLVGIPGQAAYSSSKAGLAGLCRVAAVELGRYGITVNVVAPGPTESRMFRDTGLKVIEGAIGAAPLRRLTQPEEVAEIVEMLIAPEQGYVSGQTIIVDGGMTISAASRSR
jgi:NAD(P)-dependent dehydrogenase (short-subunit alcohol dehydrogenase family)